MTEKIWKLTLNMKKFLQSTKNTKYIDCNKLSKAVGYNFGKGHGHFGVPPMTIFWFSRVAFWVLGQEVFSNVYGL